MSPRIRFASTPRGQVAYTVVGSGPTLLLDVGWVTHIERMWRLDAYAEFVTLLAATRMSARGRQP